MRSVLRLFVVLLVSWVLNNLLLLSTAIPGAGAASDRVASERVVCWEPMGLRNPHVGHFYHVPEPDTWETLEEQEGSFNQLCGTVWDPSTWLFEVNGTFYADNLEHEPGQICEVTEHGPQIYGAFYIDGVRTFSARPALTEHGCNAELLMP